MAVPIGIHIKSVAATINTRILAQDLRLRRPIPPITSGIDRRKMKPPMKDPTVEVIAITSGSPERMPPPAMSMNKKAEMRTPNAPNPM